MTNKTKILIVETNSSEAARLKQLLEQQNYQVSISDNAEESFQTPDPQNPGMIIAERNTLDRHVEETVRKKHSALIEELEECKLVRDQLKKFSGDLEEKIKVKTTIIDSEFTERKWVEEELHKQYQELERLNNLKSDFVATVSHELRTPLTVIISTVQNSLDGIVGPLNEAQKKRMQKIIFHAKRLNQMINDILDLSKLESGTATLLCEPLNIKTLTGNIVSNLQEFVAEKKLSLTQNVPDDLPMVWASHGRIEQVLINLINNAKKFTPEGGKIEVTIKQADGQLEFDVSDTGPGIPPEHLKTIFDRFKQIRMDNVEGSSTKGIGLGLAICKEIIDLHHGRLWVESEPGQGSHFKFQIPINKRSDLYSILVVDDEVNLCKAMERTLKKWGYYAVSSHDEEGAIQQIKNHNAQFDLMILDLVLGNKATGVNVLQFMREINPQAPFIVATGFPNSEMLYQSMTYGPLTIVSKPFNPEDLKATIEKFLPKRKQIAQPAKEEGGN